MNVQGGERIRTYFDRRKACCATWHCGINASLGACWLGGSLLRTKTSTAMAVLSSGQAFASPTSITGVNHLDVIEMPARTQISTRINKKKKKKKTNLLHKPPQYTSLEALFFLWSPYYTVVEKVFFFFVRTFTRPFGLTACISSLPSLLILLFPFSPLPSLPDATSSSS